MISYQYDEKTKVYIGEKTCQLDPLESEIAGKEIYLLPANCTFTKPLKEKPSLNVIYIPDTDSWEYEEINDLFETEYIHSAGDKIRDLKMKLAVTDYVVIKIAEGAATFEEYAEVIEQRKNWRAEINRLEPESDK